MERMGDLSFVGAKVNFPQMKWLLAKHFFNSFKLAPQNLRNTQKDKHVLDRDCGKPGSGSSDQASAVGNVGHPQISVDQILRIVLPQRRFKESDRRKFEEIGRAHV